MKRICIYVALGVLGAFSAHAQEINIGQTVARKISDDKVEVSFSMDCSTLRLPSRRQMVITPLIISRSESDTLALPSVCIAGRNRYRMNKRKERLYGKEYGKAPVAGEGQEMIRFNRKRDMLLEYNETVPAQEWMSGARVEIFRELLDKNHMLDQAHDFFRASGALTAIEYKDVIEAQLRTYLKGGFQLLSLNDFTGQGYAPVGILDPFWNTKGLITPEKWREFCAPTVALLRFDKRALYNDEVFEGKAEIYNYGPTLLKNAKINWSITDSNGKTLKSGKLKTQTVGKNGVFPLGSFSYALNNITEPQKLTVHLSVAHVKNSWDIWVYPRHSNLMQSTSEVLYTTVFDEKAKQHLADGKKVVLCPKPSKVKGRKSVFHNHFWNPIMFKWPPMTIGCLIHDDQPVFEHFITSYHTDWQWWDILENAKVIEMKDAPAALRPFIQVIDHYDNNEKLGIGFEAKVKKGSLLVLAVDTQKNINERPATQQLLESIDRYVKSDKFAPQITVDESYIESFLKK